MKKVLLIGTTPPPIGGVSIHIQRFFEKYKNHQMWDLNVLDLKKKSLLRNNEKLSLWEIIKVINSVSIVHLHLSSNLKIFIAIFSKFLGKQVVYTHHNIRIKNQILFKLMMLFVDKLILVNDQNISHIIKKYNYTVIPAFLPTSEFTTLPSKLEKDLKRFKKIISTNCFQMTFLDNKDLYGFDLCINAFCSLVEKEKIEDTVLILVDPSGTSKDYVNRLLKGFKVKNNCEILLIEYPISFITLINSSTVILRATRSDGDSLTVREALYAHIPIIASDVTVRPIGTICFQNGDYKNLEEKIYQVINNNLQTKVPYVDIDYSKEILDIYNKLKY